jgi:hypothetical protein
MIQVSLTKIFEFKLSFSLAVYQLGEDAVEESLGYCSSQIIEAN